MPQAATIIDMGAMDFDVRLLRLFQLASPALPVGAFSFSQGMEAAVESGALKNEQDAAAWLSGLLTNAMALLDAPILLRLRQGWESGDLEAVNHWNRRLYALRGARELQDEDAHMGLAMARLLIDLRLADRKRIPGPPTTFAAMFALAADSFDICAEKTLAAFLWSWLENQTAAAVKLVPLGQTAGQRILLKVSGDIPAAVQKAKEVPNEDIGALTFGLSMLSAFHETQHTRLFRS